METINFPKLITCIEVEKLFGKYDYKLQKEENQYSNNSLMILYGDNGSGKTTILKLLFHILSTRIHHPFILETPFQKFSVEFLDNTKVIVTRKNNDLTGMFRIEKIYSEDYNDFQLKFNSNLDLFILDDERVLDRKNFNISNMEIDKNQWISSKNVFIENSKNRVNKKDTIHVHGNGNTIYYMTGDTVDDSQSKFNVHSESALKLSIQRLENWIREQLYQGSDLGDRNVHNLYEEIVQSIVTLDKKELNNFNDKFDKLINDFEEQEKRSQRYSKFGLMSPLNAEKLIKFLKKTSEQTYFVLQNILSPYLESITARMDALQNIQEILTTFVNTINNGFLHDKKITFHIRDGLEILTQENGKEISLEPEMLSSGEKQIILLFCNIIAAREKPTIFIIDEPEISLNIKWQRQLIQSLLKCTEGSQIQFLLATHSIELLSQYDNDVVDLENIVEEIENEEEKTRETAIAQ